ncbi:hypothetical protein VTP01DRAFT_6349 [Rhizomucor pusillus]|uniref:uncharacterized protein n=1 Tax=Rhizomucor pusillus TaxID=4840 RepID=UPI0037436681
MTSLNFLASSSGFSIDNMRQMIFQCLQKLNSASSKSPNNRDAREDCQIGVISVAVHQHLRPPKNDASQGLVTDPRANSMQQCEF